jgi:hypothetical protein
MALVCSGTYLIGRSKSRGRYTNFLDGTSISDHPSSQTEYGNQSRLITKHLNANDYLNKKSDAFRFSLAFKAVVLDQGYEVDPNSES